MLVLEKALICDNGGTGRQRGGLGTRVRLSRRWRTIFAMAMSARRAPTGSMATPAGWPTLHWFVDDAHMRGSDPPAIGGAHPGLHLAAELAGRGRAAEERGGDGEVAAEGGDHGARERAGEALRRARGAEGGDLGMAVEVLRDAVADGGG